MDKRGFGIIALIVVAAIALVVGIFMGPNVIGQLSPPDTGNIKALVNAHECTRDGTCEVNSLSSRDNSIELLGDVFIEGELTLMGAYNVECKSFSRNGSGENTCLINGYDYCLFAENFKTISYLDSTNATCNGETQVRIKEAFITSCPGIGGGGGGGCGFNFEGVEPYYGDFLEGSGSAGIKVLCCRDTGSGSQCSDGVDNDGDGATDLSDFSCQGDPNNDDEAFPLSQCQDGIDNDGDGLIDYPADPGCTSNQDDSESSGGGGGGSS